MFVEGSGSLGRLKEPPSLTRDLGLSVREGATQGDNMIYPERLRSCSTRREREGRRGEREGKQHGQWKVVFKLVSAQTRPLVDGLVGK